MNYIVLETFWDRVLGSQRAVGSVYPPPGVSVPEEWLETLAGSDNACGRPFIAEQAEAKKTAKPAEQAEAKKTAKPAKQAEAKKTAKPAKQAEAEKTAKPAEEAKGEQ